MPTFVELSTKLLVTKITKMSQNTTSLALPPIDATDTTMTSTTQQNENQTQTNQSIETPTNVTQNRAAIQSENVILNAANIQEKPNDEQYVYGPVTSNELLPVTMGLQLMYTVQKIPDVLELPTTFITNMPQYEAAQSNSGPKCAPQIPPYHAKKLVHHILGTNPSQANNEYLYNWFPQYVNTNPIVFNNIVILKNQWLQYNKLVKMGRKQGPTIEAVATIIRRRFKKLTYPATMVSTSGR